MAQSYQKLQRFINDQVKIIEEPYQADRNVYRIMEINQGDSKNEVTKRTIDKIFKAVNQKVSRHTQEYFSKQAIAQVCEQILTLWEEESLVQEELISQIKELNLPVDLQSDYKLYSLKDTIDQVDMLPALKVDIKDEIDVNEPYLEYNTTRAKVSEQIKDIERLQRKIRGLKTYRELVELKIGDRQNIRRNIPSSTNDILAEISKLRVIIEKLKNMDESKRKTFVHMLNKEC